MGIDVTMEVKSGYLLVSCHGEFAGSGLLEIHRQALDRAKQEGLRAILVDATRLEQRVAPTTIARFGLGKALAALQRDRGSWIPVAFVGKEPLIDPQRLGETAAINRGGRARVFDSVEDAEDWIRALLRV